MPPKPGKNAQPENEIQDVIAGANDRDEDLRRTQVNEENLHSAPRLDFPSRLELKRQLAAIEENYKKAMPEQDLGYKAFAESMHKLTDKMDEYSELDPWGMPVKLDPEKKAALLSAYDDAAKNGESYLKKVKEHAESGSRAANRQPNLLTTGVPGMVNQLLDVMAKDTTAIRSHDPAEPTSLPELLEASRTRTIELDEKQMEKVGANISSRIPMTVVDVNGVRREGFFTKENSLNLLQPLNDALKTAAKANPEYKDFLKKYRERQGAKYPYLKRMDDTYVAGHLLVNLQSYQRKNNQKEITEDTMYGFLKEQGFNVSPKEASLGYMAGQLGPMVNVGNMIQACDLQIQDQQRIDSRNSAMSAVASALDCSSLIAKSEPMKFVGKDGKTVEGTFMAYGKGIDCDGKDLSYCKKISEDFFEERSNVKSAGVNNAMRQLADLQVLDYLCCNVDRHPGNIMYQFDEKGRVVGIQGIDNDSSFGKASNIKTAKNRLTGLENMRVVSLSMAKKITTMTPSQLKFTLRGYNLSEKEIHCACERLGDLQKAIRKGLEHYKGRGIKEGKMGNIDPGVIRVVPDDAFGKLKMADLIAVKKGKKYEKLPNTFCLVSTMLNGDIRQAKKQGIQFEEPKAEAEKKADPAAEKKKALKEVSTVERTTRRRMTPANLKRAVRGADRLVNDKEKVGGVEKEWNVDSLTSSASRSSREFDRLVAAAKAAAELEKQFKERYNSEKDPNVDKKLLSAEQYVQDQKRMEESLKELQEAKDAYFARKMGQRKAASLEELRGKNTYEQNRIDFAKKVDRFLNDKTRAKARQEANALVKDENAVRTMREKESLDDRAAAMEALRKLHKDAGMASPEEVHKMSPEERKKALEEGGKALKDKEPPKSDPQLGL